MLKMLICLEYCEKSCTFVVSEVRNSSEQDTKTFRVMFTTAKYLYHRVSYRRRYRLCTFIHELKKLSGRKYHCSVEEILEDCDEDYVRVSYSSPTAPDGLLDEITALCDKFKIPRENIWEEEIWVNIYLYTDF
jgi:hypothetical protein